MEKKLTDLFIELARISSPTLREGELAKHIVCLLEELGVSYKIDETNKQIGGNIGNIIAELPGTSGDYLIIDGHMDTVGPCESIYPVVKQGSIFSDGSSILGADDKVGVAVMLKLIQNYKKKDPRSLGLRFIFSISEEISLRGIKGLSEEYLQDVVGALVLDGEGPPGTIVEQTPHGAKVFVKVIGKEAHAAINPEKGINALLVACQAVERLKFGRIDPDTVCNIGKVNGGGKLNVVMGSLEIGISVRSYDYNKLDLVVKEIENIFTKIVHESGGRCEFRVEFGTPGYKLEGNSNMKETFRNACDSMSLKFEARRSFGGSNASVYRMRGVDAIDIGVGIQNAHSRQECVKIEDISKTFYLVSKVVDLLEIQKVRDSNNKENSSTS